MLDIRTIVEHAEGDHNITRLSIQIGPLPDDEELHLAISHACIKAIEVLLGCESIKPSDLN